MIGINKKNATMIFIISSKLKIFDTVLVKYMMPNPINVVWNIITALKLPNNELIIKIIEEYNGGSIEFKCK